MASNESSETLLSRVRTTFGILNQTGMLNPGYLLGSAAAIRRWGQTMVTGFAASAARRPSEVGLIDDWGSLTFGEIHNRSNAIAHGLAAAGARPRQGVGIMCRNHRGFIEGTLGAMKLGADALFLNTGFAGPQLGEVLDREKTDIIIYDEEFTELVEKYAGKRQRILAWHEGSTAVPTLESLIKTHSFADPTPPEKPARATILTSGTTGTPKGARRESQSAGIDVLIGILELLPLRVGTNTMIAAPTFHAWGLAHLLLGSSLSSTLILRRKFDPEGTLAAIHESRAHTLAVVPVMMQRILALDAATIKKYDCSCLKVVAASGSALPGDLALRWMDTFGDNLHNFYGSTEVAQASIATPRDLRDAPGTAGRPPKGTIVRILDAEGKPVPVGVTGRIFVGNKSQFEGYTGGGGKETIDGLMSIGDVGHFDEQGRLYIEGRDDDMIISGGENVFPIEIENLLADHPAVADVSVIGVPDDEFGQRLKAFIVVKPGAELNEEETKNYVKRHLARYKVPREVVFMEEIPRNATGKVLKRALREM
jgi:fatty-acyl-CoA synthase